MTDMEVSSDAGHRPDDDEDLIDIDFDIAPDPHHHYSGLHTNPDDYMIDDEALDDTTANQFQERTEQVMNDAHDADDNTSRTYAADGNEMHDEIVDDVPFEEDFHDVDLVDLAQPQGHGEQEDDDATSVRMKAMTEIEITLTSEADLAKVAAHPIFIVYEGQEYPLLPFGTDNESQYSVLQEKSQIQSPLETLFSACKDMLGEQSDNVTLVLEFSSIGLIIDECSIYKSACSLFNILDVYIGLCENDAASSGNAKTSALYIDLYTQPSFWTRFEELRDGRQAGKGLTHFVPHSDEEDGYYEDDPNDVDGGLANNGGQLSTTTVPTAEHSHAELESADNRSATEFEGGHEHAVSHEPSDKRQATNQHTVSSDNDGLVLVENEIEEPTDEGNVLEQTVHDHDRNEELGDQYTAADLLRPQGENEAQQVYHEASGEQNEDFQEDDPDYYGEGDDAEEAVVDDDEQYEEEEQSELQLQDERGVAVASASNTRQEEEDLIDYSDEEPEPPAQTNAVRNDGQSTNDDLDFTHDESTLYHPSHETLDTANDASEVKEEGLFEPHAEVDEAEAQYQEGATGEDDVDQADRIHASLEQNHHETDYPHEGEEDDIDFGLNEEDRDEDDSEHTLGRGNDLERPDPHYLANEDDANDYEPGPVEDETLHVNGVRLDNYGNDQPYNKDDDSWLTGYDEAEEQENSAAAQETVAVDDVAQADDTPSINSFSGDVGDDDASKTKTAPTSTPAPKPAGTLLNIHSKQISRKRSRADLDEAIDLDFEENVETKKAKPT